MLGDGQPLLFLHGYGCTKEIFFYQIKYFANYFKVYLPDLPGFRKKLSYPFSIGDYAEIVDDFILKTGEKDFSVIAHSFGARIVLKLSPYPFKKIVFTGGAGLKPKRSFSYVLKKWGYKSIKRLFGEKNARKFSKKHNKNGVDDMSYFNKLSFIKIVNEHLDLKLKDVKSETLLVWGKKDKETPLYMAKRFKKGIKNSQLITLNGGHFAFIDDYKSFNIIVKDFLLS